MKVVILGCGPAGLLAAYAAEEKGADVVIVSQKKKSIISGAQFLHESIPGLTNDEPDGMINFIKHGTKAGYATKVYGRPDAPCSWDAYDDGAERPAWKMETVYDTLWQRYEGAIMDRVVTTQTVLDGTFDKVISSIPAPELCFRHGKHQFKWANIWISDYSTLPDYDENVVLYNGDPSDHWYRASMLFGHESTESTVSMAGAKPGIKPLNTNCDCFPDVKRVGRFGKWEKGVLVHHSYAETQEAIDALQPV